MSGLRYVADPVADSARIDLGGLTALYHRPSGTTHILAAPAPELLDALAAGPADLDALHARLSERFDIAQQDALAARIAELEAAGLARRA